MLIVDAVAGEGEGGSYVNMQNLSSETEHKSEEKEAKVKYETCASNTTQFGAIRQSAL